MVQLCKIGVVLDLLIEKMVVDTFFFREHRHPAFFDAVCRVRVGFDVVHGIVVFTNNEVSGTRFIVKAHRGKVVVDRNTSFVELLAFLFAHNTECLVDLLLSLIKCVRFDVVRIIYVI